MAAASTPCSQRGRTGPKHVVLPVRHQPQRQRCSWPLNLQGLLCCNNIQILQRGGCDPADVLKWKTYKNQAEPASPGLLAGILELASPVPTL